jgi:dipeptidase D
MSEIKNLKPTLVWENFYQITQIPRPSKKEARIIEYMKKFGEGLGLKTIVDEVGNVIIKKPATKGMENRTGIILQGHLDMVPQKNSDVKHDFEKDPIQPYIDGEWVKAKGTTLGADNGMGVAASMAVLQDKNLVHGPIEVLMTIDEEAGMTGANNLKPGLLDGDILINLDSEDEGELYVGCAGGINANIYYSYSEVPVNGNVNAYLLKISGLKGGHSGLDINLGRGNANKLLIRFMKQAVKEFGLRLASIEGGGMRNAIPREAVATVVVPKENEKAFLAGFEEYTKVVKKELSVTEPGLSLKCESAALPAYLIDEKTQNNMILGVYGCPNGVIRLSDSMPGLVETSTNLASVKSENGKIFVQCLLRSSVDSAKEDLCQMVESVFLLAGAEVSFSGSYPGWKPDMNSSILKTMQTVYEKMHGRIPEIKAIHAGLECGILGGVYPNFDMISFGPTIRFPHSPDEKVHIESVQKFYDYLVETLKNAPVKK